MGKALTLKDIFRGKLYHLLNENLALSGQFDGFQSFQQQHKHPEFEG
jgi:hypothetical protein